MSLRDRDVDGMWRKLGFEITTAGHHIRADFEYEGRVILHTRRSHTRRVEGRTPQLIRMQMHLSSRQFTDAINCPLQYDGYVQILKDKGKIETDDEN